MFIADILLRLSSAFKMTKTAGYWKYFLVFLTIGIKYGEYGYS